LYLIVEGLGQLSITAEVNAGNGAVQFRLSSLPNRQQKCSLNFHSMFPECSLNVP
jgi:hypothetical protein